MMAPRLEACYFGMAPSMARMAAVLEMTAAHHCADWDRSVRRIVPGRYRSAAGVSSHTANTQKLEVWVQTVHEAPDGARLLLLDADTALVRPLDPIWDRPFDLAFAVKERPFPCNLGVMFVRVSPATRDLFAAWWAENLALLSGSSVTAWRKRYGGINQAAFCQLREAGGLAGLQVEELSCLEWNCEDSAWASFAPEVTRILHVKAALRRALFQPPLRPSVNLVHAARWWRETEKRVGQAEVSA